MRFKDLGGFIMKALKGETAGFKNNSVVEHL